MHALRDDNCALGGAALDNNLASVASTSVTGAVSTSVEDEDDSLEYFFKDLLEDDLFDLPKL